MKKDYFLLAIPFVSFGLFLVMLYRNVNIASVFFMISVLSTILSSIVLFNDKKDVTNA